MHSSGGSVISEPITGIGRSGRVYEFGESGAERVTPLMNTGTTGGTGANITMNFYGIRDLHEFEIHGKPMVLKWLREEKSNRGIL